VSIIPTLKTSFIRQKRLTKSLIPFEIRDYLYSTRDILTFDILLLAHVPNFLVAPGSRERLVQITGSVAANVSQAKNLMEDTIRRNQSPIQDYVEPPRPCEVPLFSEAASISSGNQANKVEFKYTVKVGHDSIRIVGTNSDLVKTAKIILDEHFGEHKLELDKVLRPRTTSVTSAAFVTVTRQPLFPSASREAINVVEAEDPRSKERRSNFAKASKMQIENAKRMALMQQLTTKSAIKTSGK
jgi:hypothetical protein